MSVDSKMTAIADAVRTLRGISGTMGLDAMKTNIDGANEAVDAALAALTEKGVTVPDGAKVDGLAALIAAIESGGGGKIAVGTITPASEATALTIDHGLGVVPNFFILTLPGSYGDTTYSTSTIIAVPLNGNINQLTIYRTTSNNRFRGFLIFNGADDLSVNTENNSFSGSANYGHLENATKNTIEFSGADNYKLVASKYVWIAVRFDGTTL